VNISNEGGPIVAFRDLWPERADCAAAAQPRCDREWLNYCRARESAERAAAQNAPCPQARHVHRELARAYARLIRDAE
jgi:hypothetical protein